MLKKGTRWIALLAALALVGSLLPAPAAAGSGLALSVSRVFFPSDAVPGAAVTVTVTNTGGTETALSCPEGAALTRVGGTQTTNLYAAALDRTRLAPGEAAVLTITPPETFGSITRGIYTGVLQLSWAGGTAEVTLSSAHRLCYLTAQPAAVRFEQTGQTQTITLSGADGYTNSGTITGVRVSEGFALAEDRLTGQTFTSGASLDAELYCAGQPAGLGGVLEIDYYSQSAANQLTLRIPLSYAPTVLRRAAVTTLVDGIPGAAGVGSVELYAGGVLRAACTGAGGGLWEAETDAGRYQVYVNGCDTGETLDLTAGEGAAAVRLCTVSARVSPVLNAMTAALTAGSYTGNPVAVPPGAVVTASAAGEPPEGYLLDGWSDGGAGGTLSASGACAGYTLPAAPDGPIQLTLSYRQRQSAVVDVSVNGAADDLPAGTRLYLYDSGGVLAAALARIGAGRYGTDKAHLEPGETYALRYGSAGGAIPTGVALTLTGTDAPTAALELFQISVEASVGTGAVYDGVYITQAAAGSTITVPRGTAVTVSLSDLPDGTSVAWTDGDAGGRFGAPGAASSTYTMAEGYTGGAITLSAAEAEPVWTGRIHLYVNGSPGCAGIERLELVNRSDAGERHSAGNLAALVAVPGLTAGAAYDIYANGYLVGTLRAEERAHVYCYRVRAAADGGAAVLTGDAPEDGSPAPSGSAILLPAGKGLSLAAVPPEGLRLARWEETTPGSPAAGQISGARYTIHSDYTGVLSEGIVLTALFEADTFQAAVPVRYNGQPARGGQVRDLWFRPADGSGDIPGALDDSGRACAVLPAKRNYTLWVNGYDTGLGVSAQTPAGTAVALYRVSTAVQAANDPGGSPGAAYVSGGSCTGGGLTEIYLPAGGGRVVTLTSAPAFGYRRAQALWTADGVPLADTDGAVALEVGADLVCRANLIRQVTVTVRADPGGALSGAGGALLVDKGGTLLVEAVRGEGYGAHTQKDAALVRWDVTEGTGTLDDPAAWGTGFHPESAAALLARFKTLEVGAGLSWDGLETGYAADGLARTLNVENRGSAPTGVLTASLTGADAGAFALTPLPSGASVAGGGTLLLSLAPRAGLGAGRYRAALELTDGDVAIRVPLSLSVGQPAVYAPVLETSVDGSPGGGGVRSVTMVSAGGTAYSFAPMGGGIWTLAGGARPGWSEVCRVYVNGLDTGVEVDSSRTATGEPWTVDRLYTVGWSAAVYAGGTPCFAAGDLRVEPGETLAVPAGTALALDPGVRDGHTPFYRFDGWTASGGAAAEGFLRVEGPVVLAPRYVRQYLVTVEAADSAYAAACPAHRLLVDAGAAVSLSCAPVEGYRFRAWLAGGGPFDGSDLPDTRYLPTEDTAMTLTMWREPEWTGGWTYDIGGGFTGQNPAPVLRWTPGDAEGPAALHVRPLDGEHWIALEEGDYTRAGGAYTLSSAFLAGLTPGDYLARCTYTLEGTESVTAPFAIRATPARLARVELAREGDAVRCRAHVPDAISAADLLFDWYVLDARPETLDDLTGAPALAGDGTGRYPLREADAGRFVTARVTAAGTGAGGVLSNAVPIPYDAAVPLLLNGVPVDGARQGDFAVTLLGRAGEIGPLAFSDGCYRTAGAPLEAGERYTVVVNEVQGGTGPGDARVETAHAVSPAEPAAPAISFWPVTLEALTQSHARDDSGPVGEQFQSPAITAAAQGGTAVPDGAGVLAGRRVTVSAGTWSADYTLQWAMPDHRARSAQSAAYTIPALAGAASVGGELVQNTYPVRVALCTPEGLPIPAARVVLTNGGHTFTGEVHDGAAVFQVPKSGRGVLGQAEYTLSAQRADGEAILTGVPLRVEGPVDIPALNVPEGNTLAADALAPLTLSYGYRDGEGARALTLRNRGGGVLSGIWVTAPEDFDRYFYWTEFAVGFDLGPGEARTLTFEAVPGLEAMEARAFVFTVTAARDARPLETRCPLTLCVLPARLEGAAIGGTAQVGGTLSLTHCTTVPNDLGSGALEGLAYQWYRAPDTPIPGAEGASYRVSGADRGQTLFLEVTGSGNLQGTVRSNTVAISGAVPPDGDGDAGDGGGSGDGGGGGSAQPQTPQDPQTPQEPQVPETVWHAAYLQGYPDGRFGAADALTRGGAALILARTALPGFEEGADYGGGGCSDLDGHWARSAAAYCIGAGVFTGYPDGTFRPDRPITRQELAAVLARLAGREEDGALPFADRDAVAPWARPGVRAACTAGWVTGYPDGTFRPQDCVRRDEAAVLFNRFLGRSSAEVWTQGTPRSWPDVPADHWAWGDIAEATSSHGLPDVV